MGKEPQARRRSGCRRRQLGTGRHDQAHPAASSRGEVRSAGGARRFPLRNGSLRIGRSGWRTTPLPA
jgi:hypothetical protein